MTKPVGTYDPVRRALEYLLDALAERGSPATPRDRERLLDEAGMRFNLSPNDMLALARLFRKNDDHPERGARA